MNESGLIVEGVVSREWSEWDSDHKLIWTRSEIAVQQTHKGTAVKTVVVNEPGGEAGGFGMAVAGSIRYKAGEHVLVFLKTYGGLGYRTHGWGQGKYSVDAAGRLHPDDSLRSIEITTAQAETGQSKTGKPGLRKLEGGNLNGLPLADARRQIALCIQQGAAK